MSSHDRYDDGRTEYTSTRYYDDRRSQREPRYADSRQSTSRDLVPRSRNESELSVEEIDRDFPPPTYSRDVYREYADDRYARSSRDRDYDRDYDRDHDRDHDRREGKKSRSVVYSDDEKKRRRVLSNQEKIIAAVIGGALAVGGKELYDRREARSDGRSIHRNALGSAALGAAGALVAYQGADLYNKHAEKEDRKALVAHRGRGAYSDDDSDDDARGKKGHTNFLESALAAAGLGGAVKALTGGGGDDKRSDTRSRRGSRSRSRSGSRSRGQEKGGTASKVQKAAMASLIAGATEAFRIAKEPGSWKGEKAKRVLTAAAGAATIDAAHGDKHSKLGIAESVIGGLLGNRLVHGSRHNIEEDKSTGRSRSRSRARSEGGSGGGGVSGLAALATAGLGAFGAKKLVESRERSRSRRRRSADSYDSRTRSPDRARRSRSRSVVDTARRSLAKLGLGNGPDDDDRDESPRRKSGSSRHHNRQRRNSADSYDDAPSDRRRGGGGDRDRDYDRDGDRSYGRGDRDYGGTRSGSGSRRHTKSQAADSDSDLGSSSEDERKAKKMKGKKIITTGLAAVATIHAAHNVYQSMEKRRARQKAVREGRLSPEEAKKLKQRALLHDAASVGIAALGIKGAISEMKEVQEVNLKEKEWQEEKARRHQRRLERQLRMKSGAAGSTDSASRSRGRSQGRGQGRAGGGGDSADSGDDGYDIASASPSPPGGRYLDDDPYYDYGRVDAREPHASLPAPPSGPAARPHDRRGRD